MAVYDLDGTELIVVYEIDGDEPEQVYDINGFPLISE